MKGFQMIKATDAIHPDDHVDFFLQREPSLLTDTRRYDPVVNSNKKEKQVVIFHPSLAFF